LNASSSNGSQGLVQAPVRNKYFYGKLLDVRHFDLEQTYFNRKRWLVNRLAVGAGVLCGLEVEATDGGQLLVHPGVAIDGLGREIVVPVAACVTNPRQPTDACGRPSGDPLASGDVTICLTYHECDTEPAPVLVGDCDTRQDCAASAVVERYKLLVHAGLPAPPGTISSDECGTIFPANPPADLDRRSLACTTIPDPCAPPDEACVVLATVTLPDDAVSPLAVDPCGYRSVLYSNATLLDLVFCLADRVDRCCSTRILRYVGGDAQQGAPGSALPQTLEVEVVDGQGQAVAGEQVTFAVRGGAGSVLAASVPTEPSGTAGTQGTLGPAAGLNTFEASITSGSRVVFHALGVGEAPPPAGLPVVKAIWVPNATVLSPNAGDPVTGWLERFREQPHIELTFDRELDAADLDAPDAWLRVWQLLQGEEGVELRKLELKPLEFVAPILGVDGITVAYGFEVDPFTGRFLVQIRAARNAIVDRSSPPLQLDADFGGTNLELGVLNEIWNGKATSLDADAWDAFIDTGETLPSGDGTAGGRFHSWFEVNVGD
jgi:hypothetical protein